MVDMSRVFEQAWAEEPEPLCRVVSEEQREQEEKREKKLLFLGKKEITPRSDSIVLFENGSFFIEMINGSFVIRPKFIKEYLRLKGTRRNKKYIKLVKSAKPILIPMPVTRENPMLWFEQQYLKNAKGKNEQSRFIRAIWEHRQEFISMLCMG